jgi:hypothetical protein
VAGQPPSCRKQKSAGPGLQRPSASNLAQCSRGSQGQGQGQGGWGRGVLRLHSQDNPGASWVPATVFTHQAQHRLCHYDNGRGRKMEREQGL